ncbi:MAG: amidohydrolase family protein, partial [Gaiellaceae bacterium]
MADTDLAITGGEILLSDGQLTRANLGIAGGRITRVSTDPIAASETLDASGLTILPGLIDEHFHVFRNYGWETYEGATRAAAKGGITTVVDMPLDNPAVLSEQAFREKLEAISDACHVDFALFAGDPDDALDELDGMVGAGARALKIFTGGVAPPGMYPGADSGGILQLLRRCRELGIVAVAHCENAEIVDSETARLQAEGRDDVAAWDEARPWFSEVEAVARVALLAEATGCKTVMAHLSSHQSVDAVTAARARGADVWVETCPHYLCLTTEEMAGDARMKWNPPSRDRESVEQLWNQIARGEIHTVGSDHAPLPKGEDANIWDQLPGAGNGLE